MDGRDNSKIKFKYGIISILIFTIILFLIFFSNNELNVAFIHHDFLSDEWFENLDYRTTISKLFGLEKWASIRYEIDSNYTNFLTITTFKTLILLDENELSNKIEEITDSILERRIILR